MVNSEDGNIIIDTPTGFVSLQTRQVSDGETTGCGQVACNYIIIKYSNFMQIKTTDTRIGALFTIIHCIKINPSKMKQFYANTN